MISTSKGEWWRYHKSPDLNLSIISPSKKETEERNKEQFIIFTLTNCSKTFVYPKNWVFFCQSCQVNLDISKINIRGEKSWNYILIVYIDIVSYSFCSQTQLSSANRKKNPKNWPFEYCWRGMHIFGHIERQTKTLHLGFLHGLQFWAELEMCSHCPNSPYTGRVECLISVTLCISTWRDSTQS